MPRFSFSFFLQQIFISVHKARKKPLFPCFLLCCHHSLAFDGAHACWIWDFLVFKCLEAIEHEVMKDDLSLGYAQPRAPCSLRRHVRLEALSLAFVLAIVWGAGGQMLGSSVGPSCSRGRAAVRGSWFMRLFEPCLWNQLVSAGF